MSIEDKTWTISTPQIRVLVDKLNLDLNQEDILQGWLDHVELTACQKRLAELQALSKKSKDEFNEGVYLAARIYELNRRWYTK